MILWGFSCRFRYKNVHAAEIGRWGSWIRAFKSSALELETCLLGRNIVPHKKWCVSYVNEGCCSTSFYSAVSLHTPLGFITKAPSPSSFHLDDNSFLPGLTDDAHVLLPLWCGFAFIPVSKDLYIYVLPL